MPNNLLEGLNSGRVLLMDGAMGTQLQLAGIQPGECYEHWNLTHPDRVLAIHRAYVEAGAEVLLTNTFQAQSSRLVRLGLVQKYFDIWHAGVELARNAALPRGYVLVSLGPGEWSWKHEHCFSTFDAADGLLLETLDALHSVPSCIDAQRKSIGKNAIPVLASVTFFHDSSGKLATFVGHSPEEIALLATKTNGIAALGVNFGREIDVEDCAEIIRRYRTVTDLPLF